MLAILTQSQCVNGFFANIFCLGPSGPTVWIFKGPMHISEGPLSVWYKTKFGSQNFGYQIW